MNASRKTSKFEILNDNDRSVAYNLERRRSSYIDNWARQSFSVRADLYSTIEKSLPDIPSDDRLSSNLITGMSMQSMILGTSLLSIPYCVKLAGVWGIILIILIAFLTTITADMLAECQYQESRKKFKKRVHSSFVDMCTACFKTKGKYLMEFLVYLSLVRNVVVIILLSDLTDEVLKTFPNVHYDKNILPVFWTLAVLPLLFVSKVSKLAWFTFIGMILYLSSIAFMFGIFLTTTRSWSHISISSHWDFKDVGIAIGIIINSYAVHMNLPSLEGSMKTPTSYTRVTNVSFGLNVVIKLIFGICGYFAYSNNTFDEITRNIDNQKFFLLSYIIKGSQIVFAYFTIPLQSHVVFELMDLNFRHHFPIFSGKDQWWTLLSRLTIMTALLLIALLMPHFGLAVSIIGSVRGSLIALVLPPLFYINLKTHSMSKIKVCFCYVTACLGVLLGCVGLYSAIYDLVKHSG
ncbi:vesicular inhibitory amino acid transporter [Hydra vulgaris]|uniref:vesicular inhibitory amino acid transporter n=1 Tax=Hydra vulgaris TaxID=6087 RepID=UPI001F5EB5A5|nr:vesicular inhibitory amino acid transporter [Hydra vulgaris]